MISDINHTPSLRKLLWNISFRSLNHKEIGELEVLDTLLGLFLYKSDPNTVIRLLGIRQIRNRKMKPCEYIEKLPPESEDLFYSSLIDNYYPSRPIELEKLSLYNFAKWYDVVKNQPTESSTYYKLKDFGYLKKRQRGYLINHYKYNPNVQPENYYFSLLLLFKPWRDTDELKGNFTTFSESFIHHKDELLEAYHYHERLEEIQKGYEEIKKDIAEQLQNEDNPTNSDDEVPAMRDFHNINDKIHDKIVNLPEMISKMIDDQLRIFNKVREAISGN